jgi:hypothetical protein
MGRYGMGRYGGKITNIFHYEVGPAVAGWFINHSIHRYIYHKHP